MIMEMLIGFIIGVMVSCLALMALAIWAMSGDCGTVWVDSQAENHLRGLLEMLGPCTQHDHDGNCQTHFIESPCRVELAREFINITPNVTDEGRGGAAYPPAAGSVSESKGE